MRHPRLETLGRNAVGAVLLLLTLAACQRNAPAATGTGVDTSPQAEVPQSSATAAPAVPTPSAAASATAASPVAGAPDEGNSPELATMLPARADAKMGVPVDLRYSFDGAVQVGRPVTLNLAAVPQVAGGNLMLGLKEQPGVQAANTALSVKAASAGGVYREQLSVTQVEGGPAELRVFVKMDLPQGSAFSWYTVPFAPVASASKQSGAQTR